MGKVLSKGLDMSLTFNLTVPVLTLSTPIPQNGETYSNNWNCLSVFGHFGKLALKELIYLSTWKVINFKFRELKKNRN